MQLIVKSCYRSAYGFSVGAGASANIAANNFARFQTKYQTFVNQFNEKLEAVEKESKPQNKAPTGKAYIHPFEQPHQPVNFSGMKNSELFYDFIGPEQVSAHYENFLVARKYLMLTLGGLFVISTAAGTFNLNWIAYSSFLPFLFWMQIMYFYLEGRKSFFKPLLARFYRRAAGNEVFQLEEFYHENMELKIRTLLQQAKGQIEFGYLHKQFRDIKGELINTFLYNEQLALQRHVTDRSLNIFKQAQTYERINQNKQIQEVVDSAIKSLETNLEQNLQTIQKDLFKSALTGIAKGEMTYENDPLIKLILETIQAHVKKIQSLSPAEQTKLIALTKEQLESIKQSDTKAKQDFLTTEPKIDQSLKNYESVRKQMASWGQ
ncbi:hypothetical protein pb186bvf_007716 [Paramecium bursaria]